uniref:Uncharacterized protein n=1 Tax=Populus trichocarpa TaxID=3694 RepID=A9PFI2_POPTR|nr:unknown [Populus trichocarpa]
MTHRKLLIQRLIIFQNISRNQSSPRKQIICKASLITCSQGSLHLYGHCVLLTAEILAGAGNFGGQVNKDMQGKLKMALGHIPAENLALTLLMSFLDHNWI